jgi:hypothetical protein
VSPTSVRNRVGLCGSVTSPNSAYNNVTPTPPSIVYDGIVIGYLTKNNVNPRGIDPTRSSLPTAACGEVRLSDDGSDASEFYTLSRTG